MKSNIKHFLLGALLGLIPVLFYGYLKLTPAKPQPQILAAHTEYVPQADFLNITEVISTHSAELAKPNSPTPSPKPTSTPKPTPLPTETIQDTPKINSQAPENLTLLIEKYANRYGVDKDMMIGIAKCESGFRENAVNGPYAGMYQFVSSTWVSNRRAMGEDPDPNLRFNAEESIKTAAFKMGRDGYGAWPVCQHKAKRLLDITESSI
jgi:soluble lytic murein transglycosylase-like protein